MTFPVAVHKISEDGKKFVSKDFAKLKDINIEIAHTITATNAGGGVCQPQRNDGNGNNRGE